MTGSVAVLATIGYDLAILGPEIGLSILTDHIQDSITHQSELAGKPTVNMFVDIAFIEALVLIGLVIGFLSR